MLAAGTREMFSMCRHEIYSNWRIIQKLKLVKLASACRGTITLRKVRLS